MKNTQVLYISYDGMTDPLGQSQVIPYVKGLSTLGYDFTILSYEKPERYKEFAGTIKSLLEKENIRWKTFRYHKKFSVVSTLYDLFIGFCYLLFFIPKNNIKLIHCRSYIASILGLIFKKMYGTKFVFDMRGFWADERIEGGIFKSKLLYRFFKWLEKKFILNADATISLTQNAIEEMKTWKFVGDKEVEKIYHITTCCNIEKYTDAYKYRITRPFDVDNILFVYVGSIGPWHSYNEITSFVKFAYENYHGSKFKMIINWGKETFESFVKKEGLDERRFFVGALPHHQIPDALQDADIGFFFIPPVYAKKSSSPTKMGEMLAAGIPIITGHSIGDVDSLVLNNQIGDIIFDFDSKNYKRAIDKVVNLSKENKERLMQKCLEVSNDYFSLEKGVHKYFTIYKKVLANA